MSPPSLVAWAFALSPFPAYLPQYFSLIRQWTTENDDTDTTRTVLRSHGSESALLVEEQHEIITDRGIDSLRKRSNLHDSPASTKTIIAAAPRSTGLLVHVPGSLKVSHFEQSDVHNGSNKIASRGVGLSRATVFLLLSSHLLRMLYFYGLMLENERIKSGEGVSLDGAATPTTATIQWDLFGQSVSMIIMQLLLLRAMTKIRIISWRRTGSNADHSPPRLSEYHHENDTIQSGTVWQSLFANTKTHFYRLFSPYNILQNHSFLDYLELIFFSSIATKLMFDYHWYPRYRMRVVDALKLTSIVLESCLALPQALRNYSKGNTEGLNAIMVGGWVLGDFLKFFYFAFQLFWSRVTGMGDAGNIVFIFGCVFALAMDFLVCVQMAFWYQSRETLELKEGLIRSMQKLKASHHANESLLCKLLRCMKDARPSSS
jgi:hypothetical protein